MTQTLLQFDAPPFQRGSASSRAAAQLVQPHVSKMQSRLLEWLRANGAATDNQMIAGGAVSVNGTRARRIELWRKGLIVQDGERDGSTLWKINDPVKAAARRENNSPILLSAGVREGKTYAVEGERVREVT